jgi:hypothetical protein
MTHNEYDQHLAALNLSVLERHSNVALGAIDGVGKRTLRRSITCRTYAERVRHRTRARGQAPSPFTFPGATGREPAFYGNGTSSGVAA